MKKNKTPKLMYGIEITKPWSQEMYSHNEEVRKRVVVNLKEALDLAKKAKSLDEVKYLAKQVTGHGYGHGFGVNEIYSDAIEQLDTVPNYWLNEVYPYLVRDAEVPEVQPFFVGYDK
jgi:sugar phosphate isomerase/epimerase